jgi:hypothetical protein
VAELADFSILAFVAATIVSSCPPVVNIAVSSISRTNKLEAKTNKAKIQMCLLLKGLKHENLFNFFLFYCTRTEKKSGGTSILRRPSLGPEPVSPSPSADRLSVTFAPGLSRKI